jgi:hypothetical protein
VVSTHAGREIGEADARTRTGDPFITSVDQLSSLALPDDLVEWTQDRVDAKPEPSGCQTVTR